MKKSLTNFEEFEKPKRQSVSMADSDGAFFQVLSHPDKPKTKSENREPTMEKLTRKWNRGC